MGAAAWARAHCAGAGAATPRCQAKVNDRQQPCALSISAARAADLPLAKDAVPSRAAPKSFLFVRENATLKREAVREAARYTAQGSKSAHETFETAGLDPSASHTLSAGPQIVAERKVGAARKPPYDWRYCMPAPQGPALLSFGRVSRRNPCLLRAVRALFPPHPARALASVCLSGSRPRTFTHKRSSVFQLDPVHVFCANHDARGARWAMSSHSPLTHQPVGRLRDSRILFFNVHTSACAHREPRSWRRARPNVSRPVSRHSSCPCVPRSVARFCTLAPRQRVLLTSHSPPACRNRRLVDSVAHSHRLARRGPSTAL